MNAVQYPAVSDQDRIIHPSSPYLAHPIAAQYPMMHPSEMQELQESLKKSGQLLEEIVLLGGDVLDGRNRLFACMETGIAPRFREYGTHDGENELPPTDFVFAKNSERRMLSPGQAAAVAAAFLPFYEAEAKARQASSQFKKKEDPTPELPTLEAPPQPGDTTAPPEAPPVTHTGPVTTGGKKGRAVDIVAEKFGTSSGMIRIAARLKRQDLELYNAVLNGTMTPGEADKALDAKLAEKEQDSHKATLAAERAQALDMLKETWTGKKYETFLESISSGKILKKHNDLLVFSQLAKTRALPLVPFISIGWTPDRAQKFLDGDIDPASTAQDLCAFAFANLKTGAKKVEHVFTITTGELGDFKVWNIHVASQLDK